MLRLAVQNMKAACQRTAPHPLQLRMRWQCGRVKMNVCSRNLAASVVAMTEALRLAVAHLERHTMSCAGGRSESFPTGVAANTLEESCRQLDECTLFVFGTKPEA